MKKNLILSFLGSLIDYFHKDNLKEKQEIPFVSFIVSYLYK